MEELPKESGLNLAAELASSIPDWNNKKEAESDQTIQSKEVLVYIKKKKKANLLKPPY